MLGRKNVPNKQNEIKKAPKRVFTSIIYVKLIKHLNQTSK